MEFSTPEFDESTARRHVLVNVVLFVSTLGHALVTWPLADAVALFGGGVVVAFVAEAPAIRAGLFYHNLRPQVARVPVWVLFAWPAVVYVAVRVAAAFVDGAVATAALAAVLGTAMDVLTDPPAVEEGAWVYPERPVSEPRFRGVPWWNFAAWPVVVFVTAMLPAWL